jgi:hypothetical protein
MQEVAEFLTGGDRGKQAHDKHINRVGQNRIYTPYMTI